MRTMPLKSISFFLLFMLVLPAGAQYYETLDSVPARRVSKGKAAREARSSQEYLVMEQILESRRFVLEATYLSNSRGSRAPVNSTINFILADSAQGIIQVGSDAGMGSNGVGGTTAEGNIMRWNLSKDPKRKSFTLNYTLMSNFGTYDVIMYVSAGGYCSARLTGNWSGSLTFDGQLIPKSRSRVYKGHSR